MTIGTSAKLARMSRSRPLFLTLGVAVVVAVIAFLILAADRAAVPPAAGPSEATAGQTSDPPRRPSLLLISVDTLRADHMGIYGYPRPTTPRIDAWFQGGQVFDAAYSTEANTSPSVVSFLTGLLPQSHGVRLLYQKIPPGVITIADLLGDAGYQTAAVVSNLVLTAEAIGLDARFDHYDDFVDEEEPRRQIYERRASRTTDAAITWLSSGRERGRPSFLWVHYIDPHGPYRPPPDRPADFSHSKPIPIDIERIMRYQREPGVNDGAEYVDLYDEEIAYTDREVGRLLTVYETLGMSGNSLVIFTADHGETMMAHERWFSHGFNVYEEIARVPLLLRGLGLAPSRIPHLVSLADVAPTLLRAAGVGVPAGLYGQPLEQAQPDRVIFSEAFRRGYQWRAMWRGKKKWMVRVGLVEQRTQRIFHTLFGWAGLGMTPELEQQRFYDLEADPVELRPAPWRPDDIPHELVELIRSDPNVWHFPEYSGQRIEAPKVAPGVDPATLERLRSLGYVQ